MGSLWEGRPGPKARGEGAAPTAKVADRVRYYIFGSTGSGSGGRPWRLRASLQARLEMP